MIITTGNQEAEQKSPPKDSNCICCNIERPEGFANDIEKIFWALNQIPVNKLATADTAMCPAHAKKARGLKIFSSGDELFELDPNGSNINNSKANPISEEEYNKAAEIENVEVTM